MNHETLTSLYPIIGLLKNLKISTNQHGGKSGALLNLISLYKFHQNRLHEVIPPLRPSLHGKIHFLREVFFSHGNQINADIEQPSCQGSISKKCSHSSITDGIRVSL